jgi:trimeric autotransporter adhesin
VVPAAAATGGAAAGVAGTVSTVAGGVGGPGTATKVSLDPCGVTWAGGFLYAADNGGSVRKVGPTGNLTTPAGTETVGPLGDGGAATRASLDGACGLAVDHSGNLLIADSGHERVRVVAAATGTFYGQAMTAGRIYTVAGDGTKGFSGDGGPATSAELSGPAGVAVDGAGNLVIADWGNHRVRVVAVATGTFYGQAMTAGDIYTVAGDGKAGFSGDGGPATSAELSLPEGMEGVAVDGAGNLVIADWGNHRVRVVAAATGTFYGQAMTAGDIYTVAGDGTSGFSGDGGPATSAELSLPTAVAVDGAGNLVIADYSNARVRVVAAATGTFYGQAMTAGDIYTVAGSANGGSSGNGGPATSARLRFPEGVAVDGAGNLVIADTGNSWVRVVAAATGTFYGQAMTAGDIYAVAGAGISEYSFSGDGGPATSAQLRNPEGVAVGRAGNLAIADTFNNRVRVVAVATGTFYGRAMTAGRIYAVAGGNKSGFSGDGGPATSAELFDPEGLAVDRAGNLLIADSQNERVRVVAAATGTYYGQAMTAGDIYTVAGGGTGYLGVGDGGPATSAELSLPAAVAVDGAGNLVIADTAHYRVRVVAVETGTFYGQAMTAGDIYTVAGDGTRGFSGDGGPATSAELDNPDGVAVDGAGNLVIADSQNNRVRVVAAATGTFYGQAMTAGDIYTVAGDGTAGFSGNGGPATSAELDTPGGVAVDGAGNLVISDSGNNRVRVVAAATGTFYGQAMTAGHIYTVAGDGTGGFSGDGGPATSAEFNGPGEVAVDGAGNLVIADTGSYRVREVVG